MGIKRKAFRTMLIVLFFFVEGNAQTLRVVFTRLPPDLKITESPDPAAVFLRETVGQTLFKVMKEEKGSIPRLDLADSISVRSKGKEIVVSLRKGAVFSDGRPVGEDDLSYSIQYCRNLDRLSNVEAFSVRSQDKGSEEDISLTLVPADTSLPEKALADLAHCRVYQARSARLFGDSFGKGTNIVSTGPFLISSFISERSYQLVRSPYSVPKGEGPQEIIVSASGDPLRALSSLRGGDSDILFFGNEEDEVMDNAVLQKARTDESLGVSQCGVNTLVYRRSLEVICDEGSVRAAEIHYHR